MALQVWLPLDGNLNNLGLNTMTFSALNGTSGLTTNTAGKIGSCIARTSSTTSRYRSSTTIDLNGDISMACWLYVDAMTDTSAQGVITNHSHESCTGVGLTLKQISSTDCRISCNTGIGSDRTYNTYYGTKNILGTWHHVGLTYSKAKKVLQLWVDGQVDYTLNNYTNASKADYIDLFGWSTSYITTNYLPLVRLNDVRIYDNCLSAREMKELSKGLFLHYQLKSKIPETNLIKHATYTAYNNHGVPATLTKLSETYQGCAIYRLTMTPTAATVASFQTELWSHGIYGFSRTFKANTKYCFWVYYRHVTHSDVRVGGTASNIGGWSEIAPHYYQDGWYRVGQSRNGTATADKTDSIFTSFYTPTAAADKPISIDFCCPHLIEGYSSIIEEDGYNFDTYSTTEPDVSGYGRYGTLLSKPGYDSTSPRYEGCYIPNSCQIKTPTLQTAGLKDSYTFSWWSKNSDMSGKMAWGFADGNRLNLYPTTNFCWNTGDGGTNYFKNSSGTAIRFSSYNGNWHHYAVTGNGTTTTLYIDGVAVGTSVSYKPVTGTQIILSGCTYNNSDYRWTNGSLSDYRVYATCLSAADIKDLYNAPIAIDNTGNIYALDYIEI